MPALYPRRRAVQELLSWSNLVKGPWSQKVPCTVSILIVNYNSGINLGKTLEGLANQTFHDFEVLIVDNASRDHSALLAQSLVTADTRFIFRYLDRNIGFAAGNNLLAAGARGAWLALLNPDAVPAPDWLERLLEATRRHPTAAMFGSTQLDAADPKRLDGAGDQYLAIGLPWRGGYGWPLSALPPEGEVFSPCAAACLVLTAAFREVDGFDERFFCYVEDVDLAFRLRLRGHHCIQVRAAVVTHVGGASSATEASGFARRHGTRNLMWCFVKCMPSVLFWPLLPFHVLAIAFLMIRAASTGTACPVGRGIVEGLVGMPSIWCSRRYEQRNRQVSWRRICSAISWNPVSYRRHVPQISR
jgi:N-acetylglucosaminyl-diphospho-decaprenol L-rhamnosyltransferase